MGIDGAVNSTQYRRYRGIVLRTAVTNSNFSQDASSFTGTIAIDETKCGLPFVNPYIRSAQATKDREMEVLTHRPLQAIRCDGACNTLIVDNHPSLVYASEGGFAIATTSHDQNEKVLSKSH